MANRSTPIVILGTPVVILGTPIVILGLDPRIALTGPLAAFEPIFGRVR
jgi:hypothetical protein